MKKEDLANEVLETFEAMNTICPDTRINECMTSPYYNKGEYEIERDDNDTKQSYFLSRFALNGLELNAVTFKFRMCRDGKLRLEVSTNYNEIFTVWGNFGHLLYSDKLRDMEQLNYCRISKCSLKYVQDTNAIVFYSNNNIVFAIDGEYMGFTTKQELAWIPPQDRVYTEL